MNAIEAPSFEEQVAPIFRAAPIQSAVLTPEPIARLQVLLYETFYCGSPPAPEAPDAQFTRQLLAARAGPERWETGWRMTVSLPGGAILASRKGFSRAFAPGDYSFAPDGALVVKLTRSSLADQQGFFYVHGTRYEGEWESDRVLRLYFHLRPPEVLRLIAALPDRLEQFQIPFHLKTLLQPAALERRRDGTVLFIQKRHFPVAADCCLELMATFRENSPPQVPLFTLALAPGLGMAEDPGTSFGMSRCRLLAEALWKSFAEGISAVDDRVEAARRIFVERGLDPERPYLNPGSAGYYPLPSPIEGPGR